MQKFTLLEAILAQQVQTKANFAETMPSEAAKVLATVGVYLQYDLAGEAIALLESLLASGMDNAAIRLQLGNLYLQELLVASPALEHYQQAMQFIAVENWEDRSQIEEGLGLVYVSLKNKDEAILWLTRARSSYEELGDSQRARELSQKITEISEGN
ncbi:hypothetical protein [Spirulina sp. 06S082]|uniref:hypothetical protein n=1 Tax=Spirulina sp. 06S082 TaxID=3110248 RepID=UPI002B1FB68C|nr:hypothetical protein [Spirulina sp. 06S082]MEA5468177.1 hypothetical protein [Spirulina sp. 06S082]